MDKVEERFWEIRAFCEKNRNPEIAKKYSRYFTEGYDAYGVDPKLFESQRDKWLEEWKKDFSFENFLLLGDKLIASGKYEEASFAVGFVYLQKEEFKPETFDRLGDWLENKIVNWAHTDVLSGQALSHFIANKIVDLESLKAWTEASSKWKRRAVPVTLVDVLGADISLEALFKTIEPLMQDEDKFVQKGLGWFLREAWKLQPGKAEDFLLKWKDSCGRTIVQYATEKMDKERKSRFKRVKNKT
jgi:3-methyladenine DNA glycosylase AlkD